MSRPSLFLSFCNFLSIEKFSNFFWNVSKELKDLQKKYKKGWLTKKRVKFSIKIVKSTHCRSELQNFPFIAFHLLPFHSHFNKKEREREREGVWEHSDVRNPSKAISNFNLNLKSHFSFHIRSRSASFLCVRCLLTSSSTTTSEGKYIFLTDEWRYRVLKL